ncbi:MAG TPA: hypothetical protein VII94_00125 [Candidatus Saccharimonadales bacterium]
MAVSNVGSTLTTAPVSVDLSSTPGSTISTKLQVQNNSSTPLTINVHLEEFKAAGTGGQAQLYIPPSTDPSLSWVHFSQTSFLAEPGVWNSVTMTVSLPKQAAQGYYYSVIFAPVIVNTSSKNTNQVKGANAVFVLVDSNNSKDNNQLIVNSFTVGSKSYNYLPVAFSINTRNVGNVFTIPSGDVYISRTQNGQSIASIDINPGGGNILPKTNRIFNLQWSNGFPTYKPKVVNGQEVSGKNGKPIEQLSWNFNNITNFRFGKYYAKFVLVYNNGSRDIPITGQVSFWVIPWLFILIFIVILAFVLIGIWTISRNIIRRIKKIAKR